MPRIIDQFGRKRCQKKRKDVDYELVREFFSKIFCCARPVGCQICIQYVLKGFILVVSTVDEPSLLVTVERNALVTTTF